MKKFKNLKSIPAYLPIVNIDTDMIIPKHFLRCGTIMMEKKLKTLY